MSGASPSLAPLLAVVAATIDESGALIDANAGFLRLADLADTFPSGTRVDRLFVQPDFAALARAQPDADGWVHKGLLTIGEYTGRTRTLRARIWREGGCLRLLAEYDIEDLERLNATVLDLNRGYAQAQTELAQANLRLQAINVQLKETQKRLVEAEKMASLGVLVAGVAHEINTPLGVGLLVAGTLHDRSGDLGRCFAARTMTQDDLTQFLEMAGTSTDLIRQNLERIGRLVATFQQAAVQGESLAKSTLRLRDCLDDVVRSLRNRLPPDRVTVRIDCAADLEVVGAASDWASIFTQLIGNSLQHGVGEREHGVIDIRVARDARQVRVDHRDDGVGMAAEALAHVFDPFFTTDRQRGMGLGMHLVYNLVTHRMGGRISCDSQPGKGVHFRIELPL